MSDLAKGIVLSGKAVRIAGASVADAGRARRDHARHRLQRPFRRDAAGVYRHLRAALVQFRLARRDHLVALGPQIRGKQVRINDDKDAEGVAVIVALECGHGGLV